MPGASRRRDARERRLSDAAARQGALETTLTCVACGARPRRARPSGTSPWTSPRRRRREREERAGPRTSARLRRTADERRAVRRGGVRRYRGHAREARRGGARGARRAPQGFRCETEPEGRFRRRRGQSGGAGSRDDERVSQMTPRLVAHKAVGASPSTRRLRFPPGASPGARYVLRAVVSHVGRRSETGTRRAGEGAGVSAAGEGGRAAAARGRRSRRGGRGREGGSRRWRAEKRTSGSATSPYSNA